MGHGVGTRRALLGQRRGGGAPPMGPRVRIGGPSGVLPMTAPPAALALRSGRGRTPTARAPVRPPDAAASLVTSVRYSAPPPPHSPPSLGGSTSDASAAESTAAETVCPPAPLPHPKGRHAPPGRRAALPHPPHAPPPQCHAQSRGGAAPVRRRRGGPSGGAPGERRGPRQRRRR